MWGRDRQRIEANDTGTATAGDGGFANTGNFQGDVHLHTHLHGGRPPVAWPHQVGSVPAAAAGFQARALTEELAGAAGQGQTAVVTQVLSGLGGVGKSQLAAAFARNLLLTDELDLLVWVKASTRTGILTAYARAAKDLRLVADDTDPTEAAPRFLAELATFGKRWLIVLDDLTAAGDIRDLWPPATSPHGRTVVTTRRRDPILLAGRNLVDVGVFTEPEAVGVLTGLLPPALRDDPEGVVEVLGYLPLAVGHTAAYMLNHEMPCTTYLSAFTNRQTKLRELFPHESEIFDGPAATVATTWSLSVDAANTLDPTGLAKPLLELASFLDPAAIPQDVFTAEVARELLSQQTGRPAVTRDQAKAGLRNLQRYNLITKEPTTVRVHGLVQRATREHLTAERTTQVAHTAGDALLEIWPEVERDQELAQVLRANTAALHTHATPRTPGAHRVLSRAGLSLGEAGLVEAAINHFKGLHTTTDQHLGPDHADTLTARHDLAYWRGRAGDPAGAVAALEELLPDQLRVLGPDDPSILTTRYHVAHWRGHAGDPAGAVAALEELLTDQLGLLDPRHPHTLATRSNLARWRGEAGDPAGAVAALEELLPDQVRVLGPDNPSTLVTRNNIVYWRGRAGDPAGAMTAYEELLTDRLRVLGPDHPSTLTTRNNIAYWRAQTGDPAGAVAAFMALLTDELRILGPDHPHTLTTRSNIASWRGHAGDPASAVAAYEELLTDRLRVLGPDHPHTLATRHNIAHWRGRAGDPAGAVAALEDLLTDQLRVLGPDHPHSLTARKGIAHWRGVADHTVGDHRGDASN